MGSKDVCMCKGINKSVRIAEALMEKKPSIIIDNEDISYHIQRAALGKITKATSESEETKLSRKRIQ